MPHDKVPAVVEIVFQELRGRKGFNWWWDDLTLAQHAVKVAQIVKNKYGRTA